jgi:hypothetical protein
MAEGCAATTLRSWLFAHRYPIVPGTRTPSRSALEHAVRNPFPFGALDARRHRRHFIEHSIPGNETGIQLCDVSGRAAPTSRNIRNILARDRQGGISGVGRYFSMKKVAPAPRLRCIGT